MTVIDSDAKLLAKQINWGIRRRIRDDFEAYPAVKLELCYLAEKDHKNSKRVFAHTGHKRNTICLCRDFFDLPEDNMLGVLWHEHGHLFLEVFDSQDDDGVEWDWLTDDDEVNADLVCANVFDIHIRYDRRKIQTVKGS